MQMTKIPLNRKPRSLQTQGLINPKYKTLIQKSSPWVSCLCQQVFNLCLSRLLIRTSTVDGPLVNSLDLLMHRNNGKLAIGLGRIKQGQVDQGCLLVFNLF